MRVLIEVPTFDGKMEPETVQSLWRLDRCGHDVDLRVRFGYGVAMARNRGADHALSSGYDWLFAVDADVSLPTDALANLLEHDTDVCLGYYRNRWSNSDDPKTCLVPLGSDWTARHSVAELRAMRESGIHTLRVNGGGMGCALVRTSVFERISFPWFEWHDWGRGSKSLGEDVDFCIKCERAGIPIYADTRVACGHRFRRMISAD